MQFTGERFIPGIDDPRVAADHRTLACEHWHRYLYAAQFAAGKAVLDRVVPPGLSQAQRAQLLVQGETFTDERVERYWQLIGILNGRPPFIPRVPTFRWLIAALRAHG